jgi:hypothetical protein
MEHIPRFYGMVETSLGPAMLLERIVNEDGTPARTLKSHLESGSNPDHIRNALLTLATNLIATSIAVRDFSVWNALVLEKETEEFKLFIVDGLGGSEFIPLSIIPHFAKRKAIRRVNRFFAKVMQDYPGLDLSPQAIP